MGLEFPSKRGVSALVLAGDRLLARLS